jgi:hypothetical protein
VDWETGKKQLQFQTIAKVDPEPVAEEAPKLTTIGEITKQFDAGGLATVEVSFDGDIVAIDKNQSLITRSQGGKIRISGKCRSQLLKRER